MDINLAEFSLKLQSSSVSVEDKLEIVTKIRQYSTIPNAELQMIANFNLIPSLFQLLDNNYLPSSYIVEILWIASNVAFESSDSTCHIV